MEINITLLFQLTVFLLLLGWLSQFLFKPLLKLIDERERRIDGARVQAQEISHKAQLKRKEVEDKIHAAQKEARHVLDALKAEGVAYQQALLEKSRTNAQEEIERAHTQLARDLEQAHAQLQQHIKPLSDSLVEKFVLPVSASRSTEHNKMEFHSAT